MAVTCGFFNSVDGDRKYDATQFASLFDGVITDGVVAAVGDYFATTPGGGMVVDVGSGRAWFNRTWTYNDSKLPLTISGSDVLYDRIDAVVLEIDTNVAIRNNSIKIVKGTPTLKPANPSLTNTANIHQYALAYVRVRAGTSSISSGDITINVGKSDCPFVTSIVETPDLSALFAKWEAQFTEWFDNIQSQLEGDIAANLQAQIDERVKIADKASDAEAKAGVNDAKWMTPAKTKVAIDNAFFDASGTLVKYISSVRNDSRYGRVFLSPNKNYFAIPSISGGRYDIYYAPTLKKIGTLLGNSGDRYASVYISDEYACLFYKNGNTELCISCGKLSPTSLTSVVSQTSCMTSTSTLEYGRIPIYDSQRRANFAYIKVRRNDISQEHVLIVDMRSGLFASKMITTSGYLEDSPIMHGTDGKSYFVACINYSIIQLYSWESDSLQITIKHSTINLTPNASLRSIGGICAIDGTRFMISRGDSVSTANTQDFSVYRFSDSYKLSYKTAAEQYLALSDPVSVDGQIYGTKTGGLWKLNPTDLSIQYLPNQEYATKKIYIEGENIKSDSAPYLPFMIFDNGLAVFTSISGASQQNEVMIIKPFHLLGGTT